MEDNKFDLKKAQDELSKKTINQIQVETAYTWASRSIIAFGNFMKTKDIRWYNDGLEYLHESLEHAALSEMKKGGPYKEIQIKLSPIYKEAELLVRKKSFV